MTDTSPSESHLPDSNAVYEEYRKMCERPDPRDNLLYRGPYKPFERPQEEPEYREASLEKWRLQLNPPPPLMPTGYDERKELKMYDFMFHYFPLAWLEVVKVAVAGNNQHNPGEPLHWAREKSSDQMNTAFRHIFDYGLGNKTDTDGRAHLGKAAWRLLAQLQLDLEAGRE